MDKKEYHDTRKQEICKCGTSFKTRNPERVKCYGCQPRDRRRPERRQINFDPAVSGRGGVVNHRVLSLVYKPAPGLAVSK